ncbi:MAG: DUF805 domain-containing protein [Bacteroidota bacterium]
MIDYYKMAFRRYFDFKGRSTKNEYWYFVLLHVLIIIALKITFLLVYLPNHSEFALVPLLTFFIYFIASLIPFAAATFRRIHDTGRSAWFLLIPIIPLIGSIVVVYALFEESQPRSNKWGDVPYESQQFV